MNETRTRTIPGMNCQSCVASMRRAIQAEDPSARVEGTPTEKHLDATTTLGDERLDAILREAGYPPAPGASNAGHDDDRDDGHEGHEGTSDHRAGSSADIEAAPEVQADTTKAPPPTEQTEPSQGLGNTRLSIQGMTCAGCVKSVQQALSKVPGVESAEVNFASHTARIKGDVDSDALVKAVASVGYGAEPILNLREAEKRRADSSHREYKRLLRGSLLSLALAVPLMLGMLFVHPEPVGLARLGWGIIGLATLAILVGPGRHFFVNAWKAGRHHQANMDTLIAIGTGTAWLYSMAVVIAAPWLPDAATGLYFEASSMVIGLVLLGNALELRARGRTSSALHSLLDLQSQTARVVRDGQDIDVPIDEVRQDELIRVRPGERLPVDGVVNEGESYIDESMLSGEPAPVARGPGADVSAGTVNGKGSLTYHATRIGADTRLGRITEQVANAQGSKPPIGNLADRVSAVFVPSVMIIAVLTALAWFHFGTEPRVIHMLVTATTVLIIACPCALGLATPLSTMIGVGKAAEHGVLIRSGDALQTASRLTTLVVDKTGTLTEGKPQVTDSRIIDGDEAELLALIAALEGRSEHPLAEALTRHASAITDDAPSAAIHGFESVTGGGVKATDAKDRALLLGNARLLEDAGVTLDAIGEDRHAWEAQARTLVYFAVDGRLAAAFSIHDPLRDDSRDAVARLKRDGLKVVMLTGDNAATARAIGAEVGIDEVRAGLSPDDKHAEIERLQREGEVVGMVGDGINDAPALAKADVGFAIGQGTDVAIESAGITLMRSSLSGIADAIEISQATLANIKQNLWGALGYNALCIPIAAGVLYPFTGTLLSPMIAGAAMSLSSITVVGNANRLRLARIGTKDARDAKESRHNDAMQSTREKSA